MLERFMEDLLWEYPDDFFPGRGFKPVSRQFTLSDGGRLDVSFRDKNERLWVVEVKAKPVRYADADQVHHYAEKLRDANPADPPIPALVAPQINATVSETLVRWAIEPFEISEATFRRVATERGVEMEPSELAASAPGQAITTGAGVSGSIPHDGWYTVEFLAAKTPPRWAGVSTKWHFAVGGREIGGAAHRRPTLVSNNQICRTADMPPPGAIRCTKCEAALAKGQ